jgi:hypothetical protein
MGAVWISTNKALIATKLGQCRRDELLDALELLFVALLLALLDMFLPRRIQVCTA